MEPLLMITIFVSFFCTFLAMPFWIKKAKQIGLVWEDINKPSREKNVAGSGGIIPVLGAIIGILLYVAIQTFHFHVSDGISVNIFVIVSSLLLVAGIGLIDDLFGWKKGGLSIKSRIVLILFAAVPFMVINAGQSTVLGVDLGLLFPLIVIPLGVIGATSAFNMIAGFNGLEASQGILILGALSYMAYLSGASWLSVVALCMVASLIAFYLFNMNPARVFPGDVLTYSVGVMIAAMAILGNLEKVALFFFIPYFLEIIFKLRGKIGGVEGGRFVHNFGVPNEDGSLEMRYHKIYSLTHLSLKVLKKFKKKVYENEVVFLINAFQIFVILLGLLIFI